MVRRPRNIKDYGPSGLLLEWEAKIDPAILRGVTAYASSLRRREGIVECVPAYASLLVTVSHDRDRWREELYDLSVEGGDSSEGESHHLPVCYGGRYGPDLQEVCRQTGLSEAEVTRLHASAEYLVYMIGYRPGFAFLGGLAEELSVRRRPTPRPRVAAGAVGLAGGQTGIYPTACPGGWQLIGHCPLPMIGPDGSCRLAAGDRVRFRPVEERAVTQEIQADRWPQR